MLTLRLSALPEMVLGIYGPNKTLLPERMRFLAPDAADSYMAIDRTGRRLKASDMFRSADSSLQACQEKRGVMPPGRSGHNFGFSVDLDVAGIMREWGLGKQQLDEDLAQAGWYCHRKDHELASESWHFNYFGSNPQRYLAACASDKSTAAGLELLIQDRYGAGLALTAIEIQTILKQMRLYSGDIDGDLGPLSRHAIAAFQRAWHLPEGGGADGGTQRVLALVGSQRDLVPLGG